MLQLVMINKEQKAEVTFLHFENIENKVSFGWK